MSELAGHHNEIESVDEYISEFATARARNEILVRAVEHGQALPESLVVFADMIETFPSVPLKTRTDIGYGYTNFTYQDIIHHFFRKIGLDVQTTGALPAVDPELRTKIEEYMALGRVDNPLVDDFESMIDLTIEPHVIPNLSTAGRLAGFAAQHGMHLNNLVLPSVTKTRNFRKEFAMAQTKNAQVLEMGKGQKPKVLQAFAYCMRTFPYVPIKLTTYTAQERANYNFGRTVDDFFTKMSHMVASGFPVKQAASAQLEIAQEYLGRVGLSLDMIDHVNDVALPTDEKYNGRLVACTLPNLITAQKLLRIAGV